MRQSQSPDDHQDGKPGGNDGTIDPTNVADKLYLIHEQCKP
jgi:hypothetical protein